MYSCLLLLFILSSGICEVVIRRECNREYELPCDDGVCISHLQWCDGTAHCSDSSDEARCNTSLSGTLDYDKSNIENAVLKATKWLLNQRQPDYSWGSSTPRAIVALKLAEDVAPVEKNDKKLMAKQLSIYIAMDLLQNSTSGVLTLGCLARYVNALYATCQDPTHFQGVDLVNLLRKQTDAAMKSEHFSLPMVFVPLCLAGEATYEDVKKLNEMLIDGSVETDSKAIALIAMSCITEQAEFRKHRGHFMSHMNVFMASLHRALNSDVYTKALILQALNSGGEDILRLAQGKLNVSSLLSSQKADGSFGDMLATYYAIPALLGRSLASLQEKKCDFENLIEVDFLESPIRRETKSRSVMYSLWLENDDGGVDSHTMIISYAGNKTFHDIMKMAEKNPLYRFSCDETPGGKRVFSIADTPNDVEREKYWTLYVSKLATVTATSPKSLVCQNKGVDEIFPEDKSHFVFWFRRGVY